MRIIRRLCISLLLLTSAHQTLTTSTSTGIHTSTTTATQTARTTTTSSSTIGSGRVRSRSTLLSKSKTTTASSSASAIFSATTSSRGGAINMNMSSSEGVRVSVQVANVIDDNSVSMLTKIRRTIFPIHGRHEITKFLLIGSIKFFIILALTLTRDTKDTLVVTQCGAEAIAFLKIYGVLPAATAFIAFYSKLSNILSKKTLFYTTCIPFFVFFGLFDWFIYPNADKLHPTLESVQAFLAKGQTTATTTGGMAVMARILSNWTSALFYIMSEIYSSVSVGILFWQYANDVVPVNQAKRFYPLFAQMSGLAPIVAGQYVVRYASKATDFGVSLHRLTAAVLFAGFNICLFYRLSSQYVERTEGVRGNETETSRGGAEEKKAPTATTTTKKKKKPKMSMLESAKFLAGSQYLRLIAMLVLGYGLSINFTEIMWKSLVKKQYPNPLDYQRFMGNFSSATGLSTCIVIFFGVHVIRLLGWKVGAMATPTIMALLAAPFFACILLGTEDSPKRLQIAVIFGTIQSLLSKTSKYALFDPTTQMAYIPLDDESKTKGKAAIDVLGSRIGKSGGSLIQQGLVFLFGDIINAAPVVAVIFYSVLLSWISAANRLGGLFHAQTEMDKANKMEKKQA